MDTAVVEWSEYVADSLGLTWATVASDRRGAFSHSVFEERRILLETYLSPEDAEGVQERSGMISHL